jgi:hypothetical protein
MKKFLGNQKLKTGAMHKEPFYFYSFVASLNMEIDTSIIAKGREV